MASGGMLDLSNVKTSNVGQAKKAQHSTNKKAGKELDMNDFLNLMVAMFQNQDIDNAASTTDMMNQMVQMSVVQAITNISTLIDDSTVLTYAASLVGKEVTVGRYPKRPAGNLYWQRQLLPYRYYGGGPAAGEKGRCGSRQAR